MFRRFFEYLQQRIECVCCEHVDFVDDVDFESCPGRPIDGIFAKPADFFNAVIGCTVNFNHVDIVTEIDGKAALTFTARLGGRFFGGQAVECFCKYPRHRSLADTSRAGEQVCVSDAFGFDGIFQGLRNRILADYVSEGLRTVFSRKYSICHNKNRWPGLPGTTKLSLMAARFPA